MWRTLFITWLVLHETDAVSAHVLCTSYNHVPVYSVTFFRAHARRVYVRLAVTCHHHFWQNNWIFYVLLR